ncbi:30S ribosomal protein S19 [Candidatus Vidania fulgoroideorum]
MKSINKILYCNYKLLKKVNSFYSGKINIIKTWSRSSCIIPRFVGLTIYVHNGKRHLPVFIKREMIGHKLGEFSFTRTFRGHPKGKKFVRNDRRKK